MKQNVPHVLIVDDEKEPREALQRALEDSNPEWKVHAAQSVKDALKKMRDQITRREPIDVVLTDLVMESEQSGMRILQEARTLDPLVMAILFTAKEKSLDRYAAFDYGAFDVVEKNIRGTAAVREINIKTKAALQYREWSQRVNFLRKYFDPKLFEAIGQDPDVFQLHQDTVTICFWDIRGFSYLCEVLKAHPTLIAEFLKEYFEEASRTVFRHDGVLDKFIGDGVMALFGVLNRKSDDGQSDAKNAVQAALDLRERFARLKKKWGEKWQKYTPQSVEIGLGCGIHSGEVLVGNVGTEFRDQFTALGPHVNFTARIEGRSKSGQIILSQSTQTRLKKHVRLASAGKIDDIKNIPGEFKLFEVKAPAKRADKRGSA